MIEPRHRATKRSSWACFRAADPHKIPIDPNGNLTQKTEGSDSWTYSWNAENQLNKVEKNGAEVARLAYDPLGRRVEKVAGGVATNYTYDWEDVLREVRGGTTLKYVHSLGVDEPLGVDDGNSMSSFQTDGIGSIASVTGMGGATTLSRQYDAWGNPQAGASTPGYAFTGREWDAETGLYYYRARYYDPQTGRFTATDPANRTSDYVYVSDQPTGKRDPSGLFTEDNFPPGTDLCKKYGTCPPGPSCEEAAVAAGSKICPLPGDPSCRQAHCLVNCLWIKKCRMHPWRAMVLGTGAEAWAEVTLPVRKMLDPKGDHQGYSCGDQCANREGRKKGAEPGDCFVQCQGVERTCPGR